MSSFVLRITNGTVTKVPASPSQTTPSRGGVVGVRLPQDDAHFSPGQAVVSCLHVYFNLSSPAVSGRHQSQAVRLPVGVLWWRWRAEGGEREGLAQQFCVQRFSILIM